MFFDDANMVIIRGLPGSGKTTFAKEIAAIGYVHGVPQSTLERMKQQWEPWAGAIKF